MEYIFVMEKAIIKTLAYYDIFNYPLKVWEVHKWLIGSEAGLKQVEKKLKKLRLESKVGDKGDYWFLPRKKGLVSGRNVREKISYNHLNKARFISNIFKIVPWIKLVGVSGSLAMMGSSKLDDIDLFIITGKNRIWITRLLLIFITSLTGLRRKRREKILSAAGKICINLILEEDNLAQKKRNIYLAHEVLQMRVLWQKENIYSKFLHDNEWVFRYLPNWKSGIKQNQRLNIKMKNDNLKLKSKRIVDWLEETAKRFQLKIMDSPSGQERIETGALYFHPEDKGKKILERYGTIIKHGLPGTKGVAKISLS